MFWVSLCFAPLDISSSPCGSHWSQTQPPSSVHISCFLRHKDMADGNSHVMRQRKEDTQRRNPQRCSDFLHDSAAGGASTGLHAVNPTGQGLGPSNMYGSHWTHVAT